MQMCLFSRLFGVLGVCLLFGNSAAFISAVNVPSNQSDVITNVTDAPAPNTPSIPEGLRNSSDSNSVLPSTPTASQRHTTGSLDISLTPPTPKKCSVSQSFLNESKLNATLQGQGCLTYQPPPSDDQGKCSIQSGDWVYFGCSQTSSGPSGADLFGTHRMYCNDSQWGPAEFPVCFDRCFVNKTQLKRAGLNISDGSQMSKLDIIGSGDRIGVHCIAPDDILYGLATIYCVDGQMSPSTLPTCTPTPGVDSVNETSAEDSMSTTTFLAVVVPMSVAMALMFIALLVIWRRAPPNRSEESLKERQNSKEIMIVNNSYAPDHPPSTSIPPDVPRRPSETRYYSSPSDSYLTPTAKDPPTGTTASSIYDYIEPKATDYYLELIA